MKFKFLNNSLIVDSFWSLFGNTIFKGLSLLAGIIVARLLGKNIFGEFTLIKSTLVALALLMTFGFGYSATKFSADLKNNKPECLYGVFLFIHKIVLCFSAFASLLVFVFSDVIAIEILGNIVFNHNLKLVSLLVLLNSLNNYYIGFLSGLGLFKKMAKINVFIGVFTFFTSLLLAYFFDLTGALISLLISQGLNVVVNYNLIIKNIDKDIQTLDPKLKKTIITYTLPIGIQEAVYSLMSWCINILILYYSNYGELGLYSAAIQINATILFIPGILRSVILSHLSKSNNDENKHKKALNMVLFINLFATLVPSLLVFVFSNFVARFYGVTFNGLDSLIQISIFTSVFVSVSNVYAQAYMSKNLNWTMLMFRVFRDGGTILFFIYLIKLQVPGAISMVYSRIILSSLFMFIIMIYYKIRIKSMK